MEEYKWIDSVRIVAYIDLIGSIVIMVALAMILCYVLGSVIFVTVKDQFWNSANMVFVIGAFGIIILMLIFSLNLWSATLLLKSASQEVGPEEALTKTRIWGIVAIILLILGVILLALPRHYVVLVFYIIFRGIILFLVFKFMQELKHATTLTTHSPTVAAGATL